MRLKQCTRCKERKPVTEFGRNRQTPDGLHYYCKPCAAQRAHEWAMNNPQKVKTAMQKYRNKLRAANAGADPYA